MLELIKRFSDRTIKMWYHLSSGLTEENKVMKSFPHIGRRPQTSIVGLLLVVLLLTPAGCFTDESYEPYYGRVVVRATQDFRWFNGGLPQTFDPAFAAAPPDTDAVRAIFEGLTDYDPRTLATVPAVATRWEPSNEGRTWTFYLRADARWSNGEAVTAKDFVASWRRTMKIGDLAPHTNLLSNIAGARSVSAANSPATTTPKGKQARQKEQGSRDPEEIFGAEAISDGILRVNLQTADMNFPALVAHPVFRPVKLNDDETLKKIDPLVLVSNGAFHLARSERDRVLLKRANHYWGKHEVNLQQVEFVGAKDAETALAAYRAGDVDAITNSAFEPLALKLLAPYKDFRRETYGALTYYSVNVAHAPFDDVRVREALAIAIDRDRLAQDEMGGATEPAKRFLPEAMSQAKKAVVGKAELLDKDCEGARRLLAEAGYPQGEGFPTIRLLINRNEQQRGVAQSITSMWKACLNVETEISIKPWEEYEAAIRAGDFDIVRRGLVMQTTDELTNIRMLFEQDSLLSESASSTQSGLYPLNDSQAGIKKGSETLISNPGAIQSEADALKELRAIPLYFASSYALVKPYVSGFDSNVLDVPSLKRVQIDSGWKPAGSQR
ncbi:MAG: peptide ABC transporter substrate-binding protein [Pyrinomonadaceae bacterium]